MTNYEEANIKSEAYGYAIADATKAIELDPNFVKVIYSAGIMSAGFALTFIGLLPQSCSLYRYSKIPRCAQGF